MPCFKRCRNVLRQRSRVESVVVYKDVSIDRTKEEIKPRFDDISVFDRYVRRERLASVKICFRCEYAVKVNVVAQSEVERGRDGINRFVCIESNRARFFVLEERVEYLCRECKTRFCRVDACCVCTGCAISAVGLLNVRVIKSIRYFLEPVSRVFGILLNFLFVVVIGYRIRREITFILRHVFGKPFFGVAACQERTRYAAVSQFITVECASIVYCGCESRIFRVVRAVVSQFFDLRNDNRFALVDCDEQFLHRKIPFAYRVVVVAFGINAHYLSFVDKKPKGFRLKIVRVCGRHDFFHQRIVAARVHPTPFFGVESEVTE